MKVKISIAVILLAAAFTISSCSKLSKERKEIKETTNLVDTISPTQIFTYTLPDNLSDDPYQIISQATHFSKSELSTDVNGKTVYTYVYSGTGENLLTDDVTIANVEEVHGAPNPGINPPPPPHHKHDCKKDTTTEIERTINIHFIIK